MRIRPWNLQKKKFHSTQKQSPVNKEISASKSLSSEITSKRQFYIKRSSKSNDKVIELIDDAEDYVDPTDKK